MRLVGFAVVSTMAEDGRGVGVDVDVGLEGVVVAGVDLGLEEVVFGEGACDLGKVHLSLVLAQ